jgi:hypothetical protein
MYHSNGFTITMFLLKQTFAKADYAAATSVLLVPPLKLLKTQLGFVLSVLSFNSLQPPSCLCSNNSNEAQPNVPTSRPNVLEPSFPLIGSSGLARFHCFLVNLVSYLWVKKTVLSLVIIINKWGFWMPVVN